MDSFHPIGPSWRLKPFSSSNSISFSPLLPGPELGKATKVTDVAPAERGCIQTDVWAVEGSEYPKRVTQNL